MSGKVKHWKKNWMWSCLVPDLTHSHILFSVWPSGSERSASLNPQDSWVISLEEVPVELSLLDAYNPLTLTDAVSHLHTICIVLTIKYILCLPCCSLIKVTFRNKAKDLEYCVAYKIYSLYFIDHEILKLWNLVNLEEFCLEACFKCEVSNSDSYWDSAKPYS